MSTRNLPVPTEAELAPTLLRIVRDLAAQGITPADVLAWDASGTDRSIVKFAGALEMYRALMGAIGPAVTS